MIVHGDASANERGFTLVELLVSLSLLALLSAYAVAALTTVRQAEKIKEEDIQQSAVERVSAHLREVIADTRVLFKSTEDGNLQIRFEGRPDKLKLIAAANDALEIGGLYELNFRLDDDRNFVVERKLLRPPRIHNEDIAAVQVRLLENVGDLEFRYLGSRDDGGDSTWQTSWEQTDRLPQLIEIKMQFAPEDQRKWSRLLVAVEAAW